MNYNKYIGLPYSSRGRDVSGLDCWGLVCVFYKNEFDVKLPSYSELYTNANSPEVPQAINQHRDTWQSVTTGKPGDLCLFNIYGEPAHVGIYVGDNKFLHAREGRDSVIESLASSQWSKRFQGFFTYTEKAQSAVAVAGIPHPLKSQVAYDWTVAGTTVEDFANYVNTKHQISERFAAQLAVTVDGKLIPRDQWATTVLEADQTVAYKSVAEGGNTTRLLLTLAVVVAATYIAGPAGLDFGAKVGTALGIGNAAGTALVVAGVNMAGMALINAIAPIRMPGQNADPGSATGLYMFSGASNQANRFGAIPVVLGKMRVTGVLGATPYVDTLSDTSLLNLLIIWGFGPLKVSDIQVGTNPIENYYNTTQKEFAQEVPAPVTLSGTPQDNTVDFDKLYGRDVEQQQVNVLLTKNAEDGNPWQNVVLAQEDSTSLDIAFSFPEGMRQLVISGNASGEIREATAGVEIQIRKYNTQTQTWPAWVDRPAYVLGDYSGTSVANAYSDVLTGSYITTTDLEYGISKTPLYQWYTYAISSTGEIRRFDGAATESLTSEPSVALITKLKSESYNSLLGNDANPDTYTRIPVVPSGFIKLYTVAVYNNTIVNTLNFVNNNINYSGLQLTTSVQTSTYNSGEDSYNVTTGTKVNISSGAIYGQSTNQPEAGEKRTIFNSRANIAGATVPASYSAWSDFLKTNGVWGPNPAAEFNRTTQVSFPFSGYYYIEASADDEGAVYIDNRLAVSIPRPGFSTTVGNLVFVEAGTWPVRVFGKNSFGGGASIACIITFTENGGLNNLPTPDTLLTFGTPGFYYKRKDAFNFVYKIKNLPAGRYEVQVRRSNEDTAEPADDLRNYNKVSLLSVTGYANGKPMRQIPNTYLAKTAVRIQSTSKANGNVDGINAIVETIALDWNRTTQTWVPRTTSNPASLFLYVLTHPGNAYRIKSQDMYAQINMPELQAWHEYCDDNNFEFNSVITQTQSVMDVLRDICASAKASPSFVDGKWSVIVDKPRAYITQHFTPHNSWGFESTKVLSRLPDAFRITFPNASRAYQADETFVFNYGKTLATTEIFEELSLPGVTSALQAKHLARWHLAQLKLRPEVYTINVDFEYLVCGRGDLVRVSHDVPLWGTSTGRVKAITGNTVELTESVYLNSAKTYQIRFRVNSINITPGSDSVVKTLVVTASGWYDTITLTQAPGVLVEVDNLYMLGEINKESQELIVLSVEPQDNRAARLTLADYSPQIYTFDPNSDESGLPSYDANISGESNPSVQNTITKAPIILSVTSGSSISEEISTGIYQNVMLVSIGNAAGLTDQARKIQLQIVLGDAEFENSSLVGVHEVDKSAGSISITGLKTLTIYKLRARYINATGSVSGPWSPIFYTTSTGKVDNTYTVQTLILDLDTTFVTAVPTTDLNKPPNFKTFEYRLYKDTGTEDFWELDVISNNIQVIQTSDRARFDLLKMPLPRISETGITYRVACRALDNNNNYSPESALGTIVIATIK